MTSLVDRAILVNENDRLFQQALDLCRQQDWKAAKQLCRVLQKREESLRLLELLAEISFQSGDTEEGLASLGQLCRLCPDKMAYVASLATQLLRLGKTEQAEQIYRQFIQTNPNHANARFNLAWLLRKSGKLEEAIQEYRQALAKNISGPEEVHVNIAAIYSELRKEELAEQELKKALSIAPDYPPALFNLATLMEEWGRKSSAKTLYERLLIKEPGHIEALCRLIHLHTLRAEQLEILNKLQVAMTSKSLSRLEAEAARFAMGKAHDDLGNYDQAFAFFRSANQLCQSRLPGYDTKAIEQQVDALAHNFDRNWLRSSKREEEFSPIFICGMFRSGTTLTEQILASHSSVTSGGELSLLADTVNRTGMDLMDLHHLDAKELDKLALDYKQGIERLFPQAIKVTDKRPDNFVYLGLVKALFPDARFICTDRNPLDICLSVYFQHLGNQLPYGSDLNATAHYYVQYKRLLKHWLRLMPENVHVLDYDRLIQEPEPACRALLDFCRLEWDPACLTFYKGHNAVKTASVWQVRKPLYQTSSNRWRNYAAQLLEVRQYLNRELGLAL
ncbi:tetratricopeptide repeat-containing sulfotransferase family protein [Bowmanella dokdonensis]|uniref:Sulfotransferase n=1 Tax=Bowmanella dokdonensis TaxID=751969 RepID=A0A939DLS2_9ALTE|nr:sulfotransferase [Bowmanella dokdonensis]MBN7824904.1 sulfotransferase [Bowmanella dokdonensis]